MKSKETVKNRIYKNLELFVTIVDKDKNWGGERDREHEKVFKRGKEHLLRQIKQSVESI